MASQTSNTSKAFRKSSNRLINTTLRGSKIAEREIQEKLDSLSLKEQKSLRRISGTSWEVRHDLERQLRESNPSLSPDCLRGNDSQFEDDVAINNKLQKENKTICDRSSCSRKIDNHLDLVSHSSVMDIGVQKISKRRVGLQHCSGIQYGRSAPNPDTSRSEEATNCLTHPGLSSTPPPNRSTELTKKNTRSEDSKRLANFSKLKFQTEVTSSIMKDTVKYNELPLRHLLRQQLNAYPSSSPMLSPVGSPSFSRKPQISVDVATLKECVSFQRIDHAAEKQPIRQSCSGRTASPFRCKSPRLRQEIISQTEHHQPHNLYHSRSKSTPVAMNVTDLRMVSPKQEVAMEGSLSQRQSPILLRRRIESTDELQRKVKAFVNSLPVEK